MKTDLFLIAGELSGDLYGSELIKSLLQQNRDLHLAGVGGPKMRALPFECALPMERFQVMGFVDVFLALPRLMRNFFFLKKEILKRNPSQVVTIDYPGFNLRLARALRKSGYAGKLTHYISPSVWAWGKERAAKIARDYDLLLTILPFEGELYPQEKLRVLYVGHPLAERIRAARSSPPSEPFILLFPGSRQKEIERNLPLQLKVVSRLKEAEPRLTYAVSVSQPSLEGVIRKVGGELPLTPGFEGIERALFAIAKSGTVTLELALHAIPTIVTYGISKLDLFFAKNLFRIDLPFYALPNIIAGREVFPELIGPRLTEENLYREAENLLFREEARARQVEACTSLREKLGQKKASEEAARCILSL